MGPGLTAQRGGSVCRQPHRGQPAGAGQDALRAGDRAWGTRVPCGQERGLLRREGFGAGSVFFQSPPQRSLLMSGTAFLLARGGGERPSPCESVPGEVCPPCSGSTVPSSPCQRDVRCLEELVLLDCTLPGQAAQQEGATLGGPRHGIHCRGEPDGERCLAELPPTALPSRSCSCEGSPVGGAGAEGGLFCVPLAPCCWGDTCPPHLCFVPTLCLLSLFHRGSSKAEESEAAEGWEAQRSGRATCAVCPVAQGRQPRGSPQPLLPLGSAAWDDARGLCCWLDPALRGAGVLLARHPCHCSVCFSSWPALT